MSKCKGLIPIRSVILREKRDSGYYYWICSSSLLNYYGVHGYGTFKIVGRIMTRISPTAVVDELYLYGDKFRGMHLFSERDVILSTERCGLKCSGKI